MSINKMPPNRGKSYYDRLCKGVQMYMFLFIRYPCYSHDQLMEQVARIRAANEPLEAAELNDYLDSSTTDKFRKYRKLIMGSSVLYAIKNLCVPVLSILIVDFSDLSTNGTNIRHIKGNEYHMVCLQTNCTQFLLPNTGHTLDARHFPVIPNCHPFINMIFPPTTYLGPFAMILHAVVSWYVVILGVIIPLSQMSSPLKSDSLMFLLAPRLTRTMMSARIKKIYATYINSFKSFMNVNHERQHFRTLTHVPSLPCHPPVVLGRRYSSQVGLELQSLRSKPYSDLKSCATATTYIGNEDTALQCQHDDDRSRRFVDECLPIARSNWWRTRARVLFATVYFLSTLLVVWEGSMLTLNVYQRVALKAVEQRAMRDEIVRSKCLAWVEIAPGVRFYPPHSVFDIKWDLLTISDNILFVLLILVIPCMSASYYLMDRELTCWRLELQSRTQILAEITRFQTFTHNRLTACTITTTIRRPLPKVIIGSPKYSGHRLLSVPTSCSKSCRSINEDRPIPLIGIDIEASHHLGKVVGHECTYDIDKFRRAFFENNKLGLMTYRSRPFGRHDLRADGKRHDRSKLNGLIATQQLALEIMSEIELTPDGYLNLMEKMYISFRLFMEHVKNCSEATPPLTILSVVLNGGLIIISVWHSHLLGQFSYEHMLVVVISCLWALAMIALMSNFHAKVSPLGPL